MNFREKFEDWHKRKYGYVSGRTMPRCNTAYNYVYYADKQQARWEAWQACADMHNAATITQGNQNDTNT